MKKNLRFYLFLIVSVVGIAQPARAVSFELDGVITEFTVSGFPDLGISVGDKFHAQLSYAVSNRAFGDGDGFGADPSVGDFIFAGSHELSLTLTVEGYTFASALSHPAFIRVTDGISGDAFEIYSQQESAIGPFLGPQDGFFRLLLSDPTGTAIASDALPGDLDLKSWEGDHYISFRILGPSGQYAQLQGDITKLKELKTEPVPDYAGTGALFTLAILALSFVGWRINSNVMTLSPRLMYQRCFRSAGRGNGRAEMPSDCSTTFRKRRRAV
jgi:hypothetical protein